MKKKRMIASTIIAMLISMLVVSATSAYTKTVWNYNYVGSSDARGMVSVINGDTTWTAKIQSDMLNPPVTINVLGYTWWTVRELCEVTWTQNFQYTGHAPPGSSYTKSKVVTKQHCTGTRFGRSFGRHDFHHTDVSRWRPENDTLYRQVN